MTHSTKAQFGGDSPSTHNQHADEQEISINLSLADTGDIQADNVYIAKIGAASVTSGGDYGRSISLLLEVVNFEDPSGPPLGGLPMFLPLDNATGVKKIKEFLVGVGHIKPEDRSKLVFPKASEFTRVFANKQVGIYVTTRKARKSEDQDLTYLTVANWFTPKEAFDVYKSDKADQPARVLEGEKA